MIFDSAQLSGLLDIRKLADVLQKLHEFFLSRSVQTVVSCKLLRSQLHRSRAIISSTG